MRRIVPFGLLALACALPAALPRVAWAQDAADATSAPDAETAFLRAYYREVGAADPAGALAQYDALLARPLAASVAGRARVGRLRCLRALGRDDEADAETARIEKEFAGDASLLAAVRRVARAAAAESDDVGEIVRRELRGDEWRERVPRFGDRAVPTLAALLRAADPETVRRAAEALVRIATDGSCGALVDAVNAGEMGYVELAFTPDFTTSRGVFASVFPAALGRRLDEIHDTALRQRLVDRAFDAFGARDWIGDFAVAHREDTRRLLADPSTAERNTDRVVVACVVSGGAELRTLALAYLRDASDRGLGRLSSSDVLLAPPPEFVADTEALRLLADRIVRSSRERTSTVLVDALLRDPETRAVGLDRALWRRNLPSDDPSRDALVHALGAGDWGPTTSNEHQRLASLLSPAPTAEEWTAIVAHAPKGAVANVLRILPNAPEFQDARRRSIEALLATPARADAIRALLDSRTGTAEMVMRVVPPFLDDPDENVAYAAAWLLTARHGREGVDASRYGVQIARIAAPALAREEGGARLALAVPGLGDDAARALVDALDVEAPPLLQLLQPEMPAEARRRLAWRVLETARSAAPAVLQEAANVAVHECDAADVERLLRLVTPESYARSAAILRASRLPSIDDATRARFFAAALDRVPAALDDAQVLTQPHQRELALRALASDSVAAQEWGAASETRLQDPAAIARLAELADAPQETVRIAAREALAAIRSAEEDKAWSRAAAERLQTADRVRALLASSNARERMAGIAGLVALGAPDALERLLDVAARDGDPDVAAEARRALLALRPSAVVTSQPASGDPNGK